MNSSASLELHTEVVQPEWIDYNGHMNVAYYLLAFDHATDAFFDHLGLGPSYLGASNHSTFTVEAHITYARELMVGAPLRFSTQLLDFDQKRIHYFHSMYHATEGYLASTNESLSIHVSLDSRRSAAIPEKTLQRLGTLLEAHRALPYPHQAGKRIGIRRR